MMVDQAEIHRNVVNVEVEKRKDAVSQLDSNFAILPDKKQAWEDLHRLTRDKDWYVRKRAAKALGNAFQQIPDKKQAWADLIRLTQDMDGSVRWDAANTLRIVVPHITDKKEVWEDLHRLTHDKHKGVRLGVLYTLHIIAPHIPDKKQAWEDLHRLTQDGDDDIRRGAAYVLHTAFSHIPDKKQAWDDLHKLTTDEDRGVRSGAAYTLRIVFPHIPDKKEAWEDLIRLTQDEDGNVRLDAAYTLHIVFPYVPDKKHACEDLIRLTQAEDRYVRRGVVKVFGLAFPHTFDKKQIWEDLHRLTRDEDRYVRISARHSLGRLSIFKATETEGEENFKKELENALKFFETSSREANYSSRFCFLFYRSFYTIAFEKQTTEDQVQKYLAEAKKCVGGSKNKETLLEAVENLANALSEAHRITDFGTMTAHLDAYRQYCERAADFIGSAEENAPDAAWILRRGMPIIDDRIKEIIREIQEKAEAVCRETRGTGTPYEPLGMEVNKCAGELSNRDYLRNERTVSRIIHIMGEFCDLLPEGKSTYPCKILKEIREENELGDKLIGIATAFSYLQPCIESQLKSHQKRTTIEIFADIAVHVLVYTVLHHFAEDLMPIIAPILVLSALVILILIIRNAKSR
jgi:HEAT repeat protein